MAFIRVQLSKVDPRHRDEVLAYATETLNPALRNAPGLQYWAAGRDWSDGGAGATISMWDTREQAEAGASAIVPGLVDKLTSLGYEDVENYVYAAGIVIVPGR